MPELVYRNCRISYEIMGTGSPVLFLPGTATDSSIWMTGVASHLPDRTAILVDPRDTPKSDRAAGAYTPADLAAEAVAVLDDAGFDRAAVVGYSLGGAAAQDLALGFADRVTSLALVCAWGSSDAYLRHLFEALAETAELSLELAHRMLVWITLSAEFQETPGFEGAIELLAGWGQDSASLARQLRCDATHDALDRLENISCPSLIVGGSEDAFIPARYQAELHKAIPGSEYVSIAGGSHSIPFERPEELFALLRDHLV